MTKDLWEKWKKLAQKIGDFQFSFIFSVLYYLFIVPIGAISSIFKDFLKLKGFPEWQKMEENASILTKLKEQ